MIDFEPWELRDCYEFIVHIDPGELFGILCQATPAGVLRAYDAWPSSIYGFGRFAIACGDVLCGDYHATREMCGRFENAYHKVLAERPRDVSEWQQIQRYWAMRFIGACYKEYIKMRRKYK